jgi:hypothetical protein
MANYILSYDLNGAWPTHREIDAHIRASGATVAARVLETVWYVKSSATIDQLSAYMMQKLSDNDSLLVVEAARSRLQNLLVDGDAFVRAWNQAA